MTTPVALITGAGSGIGLAFAQLLHSEGYSLIIADLRLHANASKWIDSLKAQNASQPAQRVVFQPTDVTVRQQLEAAFDCCEREFGTCPDVVVPGAGVYEPSTLSFWDDNDEGDGYKILDINLVHPIKTSRIAIRRMRRAGKPGTIVHISSIAGQRSTMVTPLYTVSKHGINSFVRGMAGLYDLAGIRVVAVAPGTVKTPLFTEHPEAMRFLEPDEDFLLPPEEVARAMLALVKDTANYKAGTVLEVCDVEGRWRVTSLLNDPGPQGPASFTRRKQAASLEIKKILDADI